MKKIKNVWKKESFWNLFCWPFFFKKWSFISTVRPPGIRVRGSKLGWARFAKKNVSHLTKIKWIWIRFTCVSLFHYKISLLFFRSFHLFFRFKFFASLHLSLGSETKRTEIQVYFFAFFRFFCFFCFFSLFFTIFRILSHFFRFFCFKFFVSLWFSNFCFEAKQSEVCFFVFFRFFCSLFSLNFCFASISLNFCLFYLRFRFRFLVFRIEVNHVKSGFFSLPSETKFSLQFQISLPKRKWGRTLIQTEPYPDPQPAPEQMIISVRSQCCGAGFGSGSRIRCFFEPWIRDLVLYWPMDPGSGMGKKSISGSGIREEHSWSYFRELGTISWIKNT